MSEMIDRVAKAIAMQSHTEKPSLEELARRAIEAMREPMAPERPRGHQVASIICGHPFVQQWLEDEQAEFETFVREVLRRSFE
jgi:hypothetical protein